jgi:predicted transcriptional regulator of viral defense system
MNAAEALGRLVRLGRPILETREAAARLGVSVSRASHLLASLERAGLARRLRRGLWSLRTDVDPFAVPAYLTAPLPAYVSLWSALAHHGMIEQVPRRIFAVSLARAQIVDTSAGTYSIHHIAPELFDGYEGSQDGGYFAVPEKALFDTVYVRTAVAGRVALTELELTAGFDARRLEVWTGRIARPRLRTLVSRELERVLHGAAARG